MNELGTNDDLGTLAGLQRMAAEADEDAALTEALDMNEFLRLRENQAGHLLDDALAILKDRRRTKHADDCPRGRDDFDCNCGLSDLCARIEGWLGDDWAAVSNEPTRWICHRCEAEIYSEFDRCNTPGCVGRKPE